jgi:hypothetical protein
MEGRRGFGEGISYTRAEYLVVNIKYFRVAYRHILLVSTDFRLMDVLTPG